MTGTIVVRRTKLYGYQRAYNGEVAVCCHRVNYWYAGKAEDMRGEIVPPRPTVGRGGTGVQQRRRTYGTGHNGQCRKHAEAVYNRQL